LRYPLVVSIFLEMLSLMKMFFPSKICILMLEPYFAKKFCCLIHHFMILCQGTTRIVIIMMIIFILLTLL
jgi:hypothetical protein